MKILCNNLILKLDGSCILYKNKTTECPTRTALAQSSCFLLHRLRQVDRPCPRQPTQLPQCFED